MSQQFSDGELVKAIQAGGTERKRAIRKIYENQELRRRVVQHVMKNRGNQQDGEDLFQEAIIVLDRNIRNNKFRHEGSLNGYLYSVCRHLWLNQLRKQTRMEYTDEAYRLDDTDLVNPETIYTNEEESAMLKKLVGKLSENCQKLLHLWELNYSMEEIATTLGISSASMARTNKYRCLNKLRQYLKENPVYLNLIKR